VNHPSVMGTSVYLDTSVVDTSNVGERGQDVRFHSSVVWSWWPGSSEFRKNDQTHLQTSGNGRLECIESSSGLLMNLSEDQKDDHSIHKSQSHSVAPKVSTKELTSLFLQVYHQAAAKGNQDTIDSDKPSAMSIDSEIGDGIARQRDIHTVRFNDTLSGVREIKKRCSPMHESFKDLLLTEHKVLSQWRRRDY